MTGHSELATRTIPISETADRSFTNQSRCLESLTSRVLATAPASYGSRIASNRSWLPGQVASGLRDIAGWLEAKRASGPRSYKIIYTYDFPIVDLVACQAVCRNLPKSPEELSQSMINNL
jgi:hypothetical protein